jgi:hypothetical protein
MPLEWESLGHIEPFPLGTRDIPDRLLIPQKLYGRDAERDVLLSAFDRVVASGIPELVLVLGYSGIGKSSVVNQSHKAIVLPRGIFLSRKFDQHKRNIPYATLAQAFQGLVRQILIKSEEEVGHWRDAIRQAVGTNGQLMVNLIPDLELVIGKQPPVQEIPPQDAQNRFQMVFQRFLGAFAGRSTRSRCFSTTCSGWTRRSLNCSSTSPLVVEDVGRLPALRAGFCPASGRTGTREDWR